MRENKMNVKVIWAVIAAIFVTVIALWAIDVDGEMELPTVSADMNYEEGELPNVDVDVKGDFELPDIDPTIDMEGGKMPDVDINTVDVNVDMEEKEKEVPTGVEIETETKTIEVPTIDVDSPEEDTTAEEDDL